MPEQPDWLKQPPQLVGRAWAHRLRTDASLRFNMKRCHVSREDGIKALSDFVDASAMLHVLDELGW